jgi:HEAT repeat protein
MIGALRLNDGGKEHYAFFGLLAAALRSDGPTLLKDRMGDVVSLLTSPGTLAQRGAVFVLGSIQQRQLAPVPGLSQALVSFVKRTDRDLQAQVSAVAFLLSRSEEEMATQDAVEGFLSRDLDADSRTRVLSAIGRGNANPKPARLIDLVTAALDNPDESVRSTAIDMLSLIGPLAVMRAEPSLRKLAEGTGQPEAIRSAARKALKDAGLRVE